MMRLVSYKCISAILAIPHGHGGQKEAFWPAQVENVFWGVFPCLINDPFCMSNNVLLKIGCRWVSWNILESSDQYASVCLCHYSSCLLSLLQFALVADFNKEFTHLFWYIPTNIDRFLQEL